MLSVGGFPRSTPHCFESVLAVVWIRLRDAAKTCLGIVLDLTVSVFQLNLWGQASLLWLRL